MALLAFAAWDGHRDRNALRQELAQRLAGSDDLGRQTQALAQGAQRTVREMEVALDAVQSQLAESQSQQLALESLYQDLARGRDEAALAEIEQSLIAANQQLVLAGNVRVALIALQSADARLAVIDRAQLAPLRRALAADMERLQRVPLVDTTGIAMRLDRAVAGIDALPTLPGGSSTAASMRDGERAGGPRSPDAASVSAAESAPASVDAATGGWRATLARIWAEFKADFRQLASIRRIDPDVLPLITPEQSWFLRENLRLRLLSARHALLARDEAGFRSDIAVSRAWVARHFDPRDPATVILADTLDELERAQVQSELHVMRSQMNPHFLFNSLNSVSTMASIDPEKAQTMISRLADLYRGILDSSKTATSPLAREIEIASNYLELEKMRFGERLSYEIHASTGLGEVYAPGLLLQTLVENAVKHGIAPSRQGGKVRVTIEPKDGLYQMTVRNSGEVFKGSRSSPRPPVRYRRPAPRSRVPWPCRSGVLIVDDEELARLRIRKYIEAKHPEFGIEEAKDGVEGLQAIQRRPPDLVFLDIEMPGLTGFDMSTFNGLLAPIATPAAIVSKINRDSASVLARKEVMDNMLVSGSVAVGGTPADMAAFLQQRVAVLKKLIAFANISFD
ncbi:MAG: uroporphyrinogen-III C-methyltransferase [Proteobacteria bacterium]|nr:uroporphyrinogen-III C-methyltransferase [Pseudomonadota bacterium]